MKKTMFFASLLLSGLVSTSVSANIATGVYSGKFGDGKATIFIESVNNGKVKGHSLYLHNYRPVTGTIHAEGTSWRLVLNEPANHTGDGQFNILVNKNNPSVMSGSWKVFSKNDSKKGIRPKNFTLKKTQCGYNKNVGEFPDASTKLLNDDDLLLPEYELDLMRNSIFARHGYSFKSKNWAMEFALDDAYVPCYTDVSKKLSNIEQKNIARILEMTKYVRENADMFGR